MDIVLRDCRHALRSLAARPAYALIVVATLALVIGAATAVLAVVNATLIRPLPFPHGDRLVQLFLMPPGQPAWTDRNPQSFGSFLRFRQQVGQAELLDGVWSRERALGGEGVEPEVVIAGAVSPGIFELFGGRPAQGRTFTEAEDRANARVVVFGDAIWKRRFGADPGILGKTVLIDREPHEVIGVMPPAFVTGFVRTDLWTPLNATEAQIASGNTFIQTFARLRPGITAGQLQSELRPILQAAALENPTALAGWSALVADLRDAQFRLQRPSILALAAAAAALLLLACANLASLTMAQIMSKRHELALRAALGGGRASIMRLQLIETLVLAVAGTVAGLVIGRWTLPVLLALDPTLTRTLGEVAIDWRVQAAVGLAAALVALVSGLVPMLRGTRGDLARAIGEGGPRTAGSRRDRSLRAILVGAECALSLVLLTAAALLLSAFDRTSRVHPGFDAHDVLAAQLRISAAAYPTEPARADLIHRVLERVRAVPGVSAAGATLNRFEPGFFFTTRIHIERNPTPDGQPRVVQFRRASAGYFETMRIPVLKGRDFGDTDRLDQPWVAVVSRLLADRYWPGEDPIGQRIRRGTSPRPITVIGVVGDVSDAGFSLAPGPTLYLPFSQTNVAITPVSLVVRSAGAPSGLAGAVRAAVLSVDAQQPIDSVTTLDRFLADSLGPQRLRTVLLAVLGVIGLALAGLGVYGLTSRGVAERAPELGVRLALGATPSSLARLVVWQSMRPVLMGLAAGAALAIAAAAAMLRLLPQLDRADSWTAALAGLVLLTVAITAAIVPARRAVRLSPTVALRTV